MPHTRAPNGHRISTRSIKLTGFIFFLSSCVLIAKLWVSMGSASRWCGVGSRVAQSQSHVCAPGLFFAHVERLHKLSHKGHLCEPLVADHTAATIDNEGDIALQSSIGQD